MGKQTNLFIYTVSFLEGGALMAFEILSGKIYTPYLGSSIYVWTSILSLTLAGLALGYHLGGKWADQQPEKKLLRSILFAGVFIGIVSFIAHALLGSLLGMSVKPASFIGGLMILFLPVTALGTVSPLLVALLNKNGEAMGKATGMIYGIGTLGGILLLLLTTFVLIPQLGVMTSTLIISSLLLIAGGIAYLKLKSNA